MSWIGLSHAGGSWFDPGGLSRGAVPPRGAQPGDFGDALLVRGSLTAEFRLPASTRPEPLLLFSQGGGWPLKLALHAVPGGGVTLVLEQSGQVLHRTLNPSAGGRSGDLRLTYGWDAPKRAGRLALENADGSSLLLEDLAAPQPWRLADLAALMQPGPFRFTAPGLDYLALSSRIEPSGPQPGLAPATPVAVPGGLRPLGSLRRGDLVLNTGGKAVPVLQTVRRRVPCAGSFRPVRLRAPYFGLRQDLPVASFQRLLIGGSEVEYLFGEDAVCVPALHLAGTRTAIAGPAPELLSDYCQVILPDHAPILAAGTVMESLHIGRLRRDPARLAASLLAAADRQTLPEHAAPVRPVLRAFDATVLAERRVA